ncbi:DUF4405 domain-containing protein [Sinorhizobium meliloti]|uniref:DUF4405 domain-containing protein n=1 Tax=Rhizobium meliloti TaxID=382 RepID=UPI000FE12B4C|nr:DUF4405 domain-containing protein [Sinorhizobium meliloti]RVL95612.1 DUF4405 domain-containing protein [Sinorhizobium meliloti]
MTPLFVLRLFLDLISVGLLLSAMAYYAFDNATHEIIGTAMFLLLIAHNIFNRRWYGTIGRGRPTARRMITKTINLSLLFTIVLLVATSLMISQTVFNFLPLTGTLTIRQSHILVAYVALLIVGLHLGLHWPMLAGLVRSRYGSSTGTRRWIYIHRSVAMAVAAVGVYALYAQDVGSKLLMQHTFEFSDLQKSVPMFIILHLAIVGLFACLAHYGLILLGNRKAGP